ncbi:MAG: topoisomerase C-terminal repeat-containing protein, partial [Candidatus Omnitrophica bacterium]|nr:topoisomerase C-terminal repeat-containing protein [Candidatus Omnitrophota bacterium]
ASIQSGLNTLHDGKDFDYLGQSAQCRAFADWIVGLNATRAYSISNGQLYTVGRVQTPTLALIVNRQHIIDGFEKCYYYELYAKTKNVAFRWEDKDGYKIEKKDKAEDLKKRLEGKTGEIANIKITSKNTTPPPLFDLTLLQKECNEKFGYTAKETLEYAQDLYEKQKLISYPRTESRHLSENLRPELPAILRSAPDNLKDLAKRSIESIESGNTLGKNYINDKKLTDHHAIIPTKKKLQGRLPSHLENVYMLVQKRFISIFYPDFVEDVTEIIMHIDQELFKFKGSRPTEIGWRVIYQKGDMNTSKSSEETPEGSNVQNSDLAQFSIRQEVIDMMNARFEKGQVLPVDSLEVQEKETSAPKPFTDGTLLNAMRYIGRQVDDDTLAAHLKDQGLGTQATRATIIERLIKSQYIIRKGKALIPTKKGIQLIDTVMPDLKSPELTAQWEQKLTEINDGDLNDAEFMEEIKSFTEMVITAIKNNNSLNGSIGNKTSFGTCPKCEKGQVYEGKNSYYCSRYRDGCQFNLWATIASKKLDHEQVKKIVKDRRSDLIKGFTSKKGQPFNAIVELDEEFKTRFCF